MKELANSWQRKWLALDAHHPKLQDMANAIERLAASWFCNDKTDRHLLVLVGRTGCGKTHCVRRLANWAQSASATAWDKHFWENPPSVRYTAWTEICDSYNRDPKQDIVGHLNQNMLLVLDDVGAEVDKYKTGEMNLKLQMLMDRRSKLWTVITTNVLPSQWSTRWDERIADRFLRDSIVCDISDVESYSTLKA